MTSSAVKYSKCIFPKHDRDSTQPSSRYLSILLDTTAVLLTIAHQTSNCLFPLFAMIRIHPREATGRIVCANCHLAKKPVDIEAPQSILPDTVFEAVVKIPYDT